MASLDEVKDLDAAGLGKLNKAQLAKLLESALSDKTRLMSDLAEMGGTDDEDDSSILRQLRSQSALTLQTVQRFDARMEKYEQRLGQLEVENQSMRNEIKSLWSVVDDQVRQLEYMDSTERANKLVIFGVPDGTWNGCDTDSEKVQLIGTTAGCEINDFTAKRVGKLHGGTSRPIHVILKDGAKRNEIVSKTKDVSNHAGFTSVKVKKDVHPAVRREWGRLYASYDSHKTDPQNTGHVIEFDKKKRCITRDQDVVDSWRPRFSDF